MATTTGTSGNDSWIVVKAGTFTLDGLGGTDTLALGTSLRSQYTVKQVGSAVLVDSVSGASSALHATLYNMEILTFDSGRDVLDLTTYFKPADQYITLNGSGLNDTFALSVGNYNVNGGGGLDTATLSQPSDPSWLRSELRMSGRSSRIRTCLSAYVGARIMVGRYMEDGKL